MGDQNHSGWFVPSEITIPIYSWTSIQCGWGVQAIEPRCNQSTDKGISPILSPKYFFSYIAHNNLGQFEIVNEDAPKRHIIGKCVPVFLRCLKNCAFFKSLIRCSGHIARAITE